MKLESGLPPQSPWLHIAPLLTVLLLLLVYFVLSSGFSAQSGVTVRLPESAARLSGFDRAQVITVASGENPRLLLNGRPVTTTALATELAAMDPLERRALIYADRSIPFGKVMEIGRIALDLHFDVAYATATPDPGMSQ
jgi:biopolymer transport protein ExbD